ncbi:MAG: hypothetical protein GC192_05970 [Bacteroidetes bacterium]|nr:hypothetical protein [Bacteroidota bacterium]
MKKAIRPNVGHAILFGVNKLDNDHYSTSSPKSYSAELDVADYALISKLSGLNVTTFFGASGTRINFLNTLKKTSKSLKAGDFLLLTFSGFGGVITNFGNPDSEPLSPTWCFYNAQVLISEVHQVLSEFEAGVNIFVIADASSTMTGLRFQSFQEIQFNDNQRSLQVGLAETVYLQNKDFYDGIYLGSKQNPPIKANVLWISACQINQVAFETIYNGYLTASIKHVWNGAAFKGDYKKFFQEIILSMPAYQSPAIIEIGNANYNFSSKRPFIV